MDRTTIVLTAMCALVVGGTTVILVDTVVNAGFSGLIELNIDGDTGLRIDSRQTSLPHGGESVLPEVD